jgi:D-3-phosphoglycerate dehydrogenase
MSGKQHLSSLTPAYRRSTVLPPRAKPSHSAQWRILIPTALSPEGVAILKAEPTFDVDLRPGLKGAELLKALKTADAVIIRSEHKIDAATVAAAGKLRLVARAGVGVENVDLDACTSRGIVVLNTPAANSIAVAELTMAMMLALSRKIVAADNSVKAGKWEKGRFGGHELFGKTLGLVGFGRIGREVGLRAASFGMKVIAYDPYVTEAAAKATNVTLMDLPDVIKTADVISLHLPLNDKTRNLIDASMVKRMKKTALLVNAARGGIVDERALAKALTDGQIAGCALDVFAKEPPDDHWFGQLENVVVTPHLGASTAESQTKVAVEIAQAVRRALVEGVYVNAVNLPIADPSDLPRLLPYLKLAEKIGLLLRMMETGACDTITLELGSQTISEAKLVTAAAVRGFLSPQTDTSITMVNAMAIAAERHVRVAVIDQSADEEYSNAIAIDAKCGRHTHRVTGVVENGAALRLRQIDEFPLDIQPCGRVLIFTNKDRPGVIGAVGALLGKAKVNIASWNLGRRQRGGTALGIVAVDDPVPQRVIDALGELPNLSNVVQVDWGE